MWVEIHIYYKIYKIQLLKITINWKRNFEVLGAEKKKKNNNSNKNPTKNKITAMTKKQKQTNKQTNKQNQDRARVSSLIILYLKSMTLKKDFQWKRHCIFLEFLYLAVFCPAGRTKGWVFFPHITHFEGIFKEMAFYFP